MTFSTFTRVNVERFISQEYINLSAVDVNRNTSRSGAVGNKRRQYRTFKFCSRKIFIFDRSHLGTLAKFRSGTAPIALETGRFSGLEVSERKCFSCRNAVEGESHVLLHCPLYTELHNEHILRGPCKMVFRV